MTDSASPTPASHKPTLAPGQKIFLRISGIVAMALFLLPTFYVLKYYALDFGREQHIIGIIAPEDLPPGSLPAGNIQRKHAVINAAATSAGFHDLDQIPLLVEVARHDTDTALRITAIQALGKLLGNTSVNFERPMECLQSKSALADIAAHDPNASVKSAAQEEIGKIAQGGAVVRR